MEVSKKIPTLRFPGFEGEWEEKKLGEVANCLDNLRKPLNNQERQTKSGAIPYYGANGIVDYIDDYIFDKKLVLLAEDGGNFDDFSNRPIAQLIKGKSWVNNHAHVLEGKENTDFLFFSLVHKDIRKYINGTSRAKLNKVDMLEIKLNLPPFPEQQKIADCLTAMDESIESQQQKVEQLQSYKKGLLQQLFSQTLRFPGFEGEWEEKKLGEVCKITTGKLDANAMVEGGAYHFFTCAKECFKIDKYAFDTEALLISGNGANVGYIHYFNGKFNAYQRTYVLDSFQENIFYVKFFLEKYLPYRISREKNDGATPYIVLNTLYGMNIKYPNSFEQQKIADCLSTLDEVIELEQQKFEKLQVYKKGLLQQLFV